MRVERQEPRLSETRDIGRVLEVNHQRASAMAILIGENRRLRVSAPQEFSGSFARPIHRGRRY